MEYGELVNRFNDIQVLEDFLEEALENAYGCNEHGVVVENEETVKIDQAWIRLRSIIEKAR